MPVLRAALVTPLSGPLAAYGTAGAEALALWARAAADLPAPLSRVELAVRDAHPDPGAAMRAAVAGRPHLVFGPYGSGPALAAARATDRLVWNHGGATSALAWPDHPHVVNVLSPASSYFAGALELIRAADPGVRTVALLHASTGFGRDVAGGALAAAARLGLSAPQVAFEPGGVEAAARDLPGADTLLVVGSFADEVAAARVLLRRPWPAAAFVGAGEEDVLAELGPGREGLLGPAQWLPRSAPQPDEGPDAGWFVRRFAEVTGRPPPYPAAQAFAAGVLAARAVRDAGGTGDEALLAVARRLACTTMYGPFRLDASNGRQVGHRVLTVQWQGGSRRVVWPPERAEARLTYPRGTHP